MIIGGPRKILRVCGTFETYQDPAKLFDRTKTAFCARTKLVPNRPRARLWYRTPRHVFFDGSSTKIRIPNVKPPYTFVMMPNRLHGIIVIVHNHPVGVGLVPAITYR